MQGNRKQNERNQKTKARPYFFFERTGHTFINYNDAQVFLDIAKELYEAMRVYYVYYYYVLHACLDNIKVGDENGGVEDGGVEDMGTSSTVMDCKKRFRTCLRSFYL